MDDFGKLLLRLSLGGLMGFHGVQKAMDFEATEKMISGLLTAKGLPAEMFYGVFVMELLAPLLMVLGFWTRISSFVFAAGMGMAVYLAHMGELATLNDHGAYALELQGLFFFGALALVFMGPGRIALQPEGPGKQYAD